MNKEPKEKINISLKQLETILDWFNSQEDLDVEIALQKAKEGANLIKELKSKLKKVENEFEEIKKELI